MNLTKTSIIAILLLFTFQTMKSQTYITSNIQTYLVNKKWSIIAGKNKKISFLFKDTGKFHLYIDDVEIGTEDYYVASSSECGNTVLFNNSKIGTTSSGNYIKTLRECYIIEFFTGYQKFRLKRALSTKWQVYSLD